MVKYEFERQDKAQDDVVIAIEGRKFESRQVCREYFRYKTRKAIYLSRRAFSIKIADPSQTRHHNKTITYLKRN